MKQLFWTFFFSEREKKTLSKLNAKKNEQTENHLLDIELNTFGGHTLVSFI